MSSGCVAPRNCGVQIGLTSKTKNPEDNFFRGLIDEVCMRLPNWTFAARHKDNKVYPMHCYTAWRGAFKVFIYATCFTKLKSALEYLKLFKVICRRGSFDYLFGIIPKKQLGIQDKITRTCAELSFGVVPMCIGVQYKLHFVLNKRGTFHSLWDGFFRNNSCPEVNRIQLKKNVSKSYCLLQVKISDVDTDIDCAPSFWGWDIDCATTL